MVPWHFQPTFKIVLEESGQSHTIVPPFGQSLAKASLAISMGLPEEMSNTQNQQAVARHPSLQSDGPGLKVSIVARC